MKKNFAKKLALGLALVMTVGSVNMPVAAEAASNPAFKSTAVKLEVGQTKKYNMNAEVKNRWSVKKFVIGNKKVAEITAQSKAGKGKTKYVKVTGVAEGTTKLRADLKAYKSKRELSVRIPVTVTAAADTTPETPVVVEAALASVKQTASNKLRLTFTADASKKFTKDSFSVSSVTATSVLSVKDVTFSADGLTADLTIYNNFEDGISYNVVCGSVTESFVASVGEVSKVVIHTASAQENVETPIEFSLYDANEIDVTSSVDLDAHCVITVTGSHSGTNIARASEATITMNGIGTTADVTVVYNSNKVGAADVTETTTITCVDAKAVIGNMVFADTTNVNENSGAAKFYLGLSATSVSVEENEKTEDVYFCAKDGNEVISYDSYAVESSNEDVMNVEIYGNTDSGKYARFTVTGNNIGSAYINITAEKNGKVTKYTIPVTVTKINEAVRMDVTVSDPVMSNVDDSEYFGVIEGTLYDAKGNEVGATFTYELNETNKANRIDPTGGLVYAQNATAGSYSVKVTGADNRTGKTFIKNVGITVKSLPADADPVSGAGIKVTYQVKLVENTAKPVQKTSFDIAAFKATATANTKSVSARLYATYNGLFAGYVRQTATGSAVTVAENHVKVARDSQLDNATVLVRFGNLVFNEVSDLLGNGADIRSAYSSTLESIGDVWKTYTFIEDKTSDNIIVYGDVIGGLGTDKNEKAYSEVARSGYYVVEYNLDYTTKSTIVKKTQSFTLVDKVNVPVVTVESRKIAGTSLSDVRDVLAANVDMNNNISNHESILSVHAADGTSPTATSNNTKLTVKYALVEDNYGTKDWNFYVPINTTFTVE